LAFESLAEKLQLTFKKLRGRGKLSETDVTDALKEIRMALLEADVNFKVVKDFVAKIKERAVGQEVMESLTPAQHVIKIVNEELTELLGGTQSRIAIAPKPPTVVMLVGLQGAGKTTTAGKLANLLTRQGKRPLLTAADVYRPAAIKQLQVLGESLDIPVFSIDENLDPVDISKKSLDKALSLTKDIVIIDTAGRLHINEELMNELKSVKASVKPHEILLVVDAMTGQDAVTVAETFDAELGIDGIILTKLDGDARGGAALSVKAVTGKPIKFVGMGEKMDALEVFHPDRMASRILGMGDVLSLIEKAESTLNIEKAQELQKKLRKEELTLDDFMEQMEQMKKMGSLGQIMNMIPGMNKVKGLDEVDLDGKQMNQVIAIIKSMTPKERQNPAIINGSRRKRIAAGSGTTVQDINRLLKQFAESKKMMKRFAEMQKSGKKNSFKLPSFFK
jgi:signal recognition particle subunit SRP54